MSKAGGIVGGGSWVPTRSVAEAWSGSAKVEASEDRLERSSASSSSSSSFSSSSAV